MSTSRLVLAVVGLCLAALAEQGQAQRLTPDTSARNAAIAGLKRGQQLRLAVALQGRMQGRLAHIDGELLRFETAGGIRSVHLAAIDTLWVRGEGAAHGFLIGWLITSAGVGVVEFSACTSFTNGHCGLGHVALIVAISAFLGLPGGGIGAALGRASDPWRPIP